MISLRQLSDQLRDTLGIPVAYRDFSREKSGVPAPPFLVYYIASEEVTAAADNIAYIRSDNIVVELYSRTRDVVIEQKIKDILDSDGVYYDITYGSISDGDMQVAYFNFQLLIH